MRNPWHGWFECCCTSTETVGLLRTGARDGHLDFHTAPELWRAMACSAISYGLGEREQELAQLQTSPAPIRSVGRIELTQHNTQHEYAEVLLYVHRNRRCIRDGSQDGHLDFHTAPQI